MAIEPLSKPGNPEEDKIQALKELFPQVFSDGKLNLDALKEELADYVDDLPKGDEHYGLNWPGKRDAKKLATKAPTGTLKPVPGEGVNEDTTKNLIIEGDNLEVLRIMQKAYAGRIKMIYIDPPYNTGNDFVYKDDFADPVETYLKRTGQADEEGLLVANAKASGRYHSNWLNMMYPRLRLARNLLREDGVIFISIDDNEVNNLKTIMDEVFGGENFVSTFTWKKRTGSNDTLNMVSNDHEYVLAYAKSELMIFNGDLKDLGNYKNPDNDPRGPWARDNLTCNKTASERPNLYYQITDPTTGIQYDANPNRVWAYEKKRMQRIILEGKVLFPKEPNGTPMYKRHVSELRSNKKPFSSVLNTVLNSIATKETRDILGGQYFDFPKSIDLIKRLLKQTTNQNDIVLDFFAGSGTTAHAVMELNQEDGGNRKVILVQLPEKTDEKSEAYKAGFKTIADITRERVRRVIPKIKQGHPQANSDLGFRSLKLNASNLRKWTDYEGNDPQALGQLFEALETPFVDGWTPEGVLTEVMLVEGFPLDSTVSQAEGFGKNSVHEVVHPDLDLTLMLCLDERLDSSLVTVLAGLENTVFVCREKALTDELKLRLKDVISVKTL